MGPLFYAKESALRLDIAYRALLTGHHGFQANLGPKPPLH